MIILVHRNMLDLRHPTPAHISPGWPAQGKPPVPNPSTTDAIPYPIQATSLVVSLGDVPCRGLVAAEQALTRAQCQTLITPIVRPRQHSAEKGDIYTRRS
jgi:hypothetical protein